MTTPIVHLKHARYGHFSRQRYARRLLAFLAAQGTRLTSSASAQTIVPVAIANVTASDLFTMGTQPANNKIVTIKDRVYKFKTALTEAKATGTFTGSGNPTAAQTLTIGTKVYTFQTSLTNVDGNIKVGADLQATLVNIKNAINASGGTPGTDYATANTVHPTVTATSDATHLVVTAKTVGVAGNLIASTGTAGSGSWGAALLAGGLDSIADEVFIGSLNTDSIDNLVLAINLGATAGTNYSTATIANAEVTAGTRSGNTTLVTSIALGSAGNSINASTDVGSATWATDHLAGGVTATWGPTVTATTHGISEGEGPYLITSSNGSTHVPAGYTPGDFLYVHVNNASLITLYKDAGLTELQTFTGAGTGTISLTKSVANAGIYDTLKRNTADALVAVSDIDSLK
jgi:hypothetical protein